MATRPPKVLLMCSSDSVGVGVAEAGAFMAARSWPGCPPAEAAGQLFDDRVAAREARNAHDIGSGHEGLRTEAEDHGVADLRFRSAARIDHAVVVDRGRGWQLNVSQRCSRSRRLRGDDGLDLVVGKHGVDIEATTETERLVADEMRHFSEIDHSGPFG